MEFSTVFDELKNRSYSGTAAPSLSRLKFLCSDGYEWAARNKNLMAISGGITLVLSFLEPSEEPGVLIETLDLLHVLCKNMGKEYVLFCSPILYY